MVNIFFTADTHFNHGNVIRYCKRPQYYPEDYIEIKAEKEYEEEDKRKLVWASSELKHQRVSEMNEMIIENWNNKVRKSDVVYHLGDFCFGNKGYKEVLPRLNGRIHLVLGNHDKKNLQPANDGFASVTSLRTLQIDKQVFVLCHYPIARWDRSHYGVMHLHGHCHGSYKPKEGKILDVGIDVHSDFTVWHLDEVLAYMETRSMIGHHEENDDSY